MIQGFIEMAGALVACMGFALIYQNKPKRVFLAGLCGAVTWGVCLIADHYTEGNIFVSYLIAATFGTMLSEVLARVTKAPATLYLILGILPMVPGGSLYYTTYNLVMGNQGTAKYFGTRTVLAATGIAVGIIIVSVITYYINYLRGHNRGGINGVETK